MFIAEIQEGDQLPTEKIIIDTEVAGRVYCIAIWETGAPEIEKVEEDLSVACSKNL